MSGSILPTATIGSLEVQTNLRCTNYVDDSATAGNRTVNALRGKSSFAGGAKTVVITNSLVTADSVVLCNLEFVDATLTQILTCIPTAGSFTVLGDVNATAATKFSWFVIN